MANESAGASIPFLRVMRDAKRLAVRVEPTCCFDLEGVAAVVDEVAKACKWPQTTAAQ